MNLELEGHRVIVTAGGGGIGRATAEAFLQEGARVFVCDLDQDTLDGLKSEYPDIVVHQCDVSNEAGVDDMFAEALKFLGGLDCLVNNAGSTGPTMSAEAIESSDWQKCLDVNLNGNFYCTNRAIPHLRKSSNPSIISLSSAAGRLGYPNKSPYVAAKWGIIGFMKTVSIENGAYGIRCNAVLPGPVDNARMKGVIAQKAKLAGVTPAEQEKTILSLTSLKALIKPEEVADLIIFLSSKRARNVSGQAISIDGDLQALV